MSLFPQRQWENIREREGQAKPGVGRVGTVGQLRWEEKAGGWPWGLPSDLNSPCLSKVQELSRELRKGYPLYLLK